MEGVERELQMDFNVRLFDCNSAEKPFCGNKLNNGISDSEEWFNYDSKATVSVTATFEGVKDGTEANDSQCYCLLRMEIP